MKAPPVSVFSSVGGGPMKRLAQHLRERGRRAELVCGLDPMVYRRLMGSRLGRLRARFRAMVAFPLRALARAASPASGTLVPTTNPFFLPAFLVATKALHGRPVVPLLYDLYPDALEVAANVEPGSLVSRLGSLANRFVMSQADGVVFIGERMGGHARERYGEPRRHTTLQTGAVCAEFAGARAERFVLDEWIAGRRLASYVGNMGHVHDYRTLRDGLAQLGRSNLDLAVVISASGPGVEALRRELPEECEPVVRFLPPLGDADWRALLGRTDIALVTLREKARHTSVPSKTFSAMAAECAILAVAPRDCDLADVVLGADCGEVVQPGNSIQLFDALSRLVRDPSELGRLQKNAVVAARDRYDLEVLAAGWDRFLSEVERHRRPGIGYETTKRLIDIAVAAGGLVALGPAMLAIAAAVRATTGSPVLFRQRRPGYLGRPFELLKFRSMRDPGPGESGLESDAERLTPLGRALRATSLDELPELINVLRGEMSLVGPRPLLMQYLDRYSPQQMRRHDVVPGITGRAQVKGRNAISWPEKFEHDLWYVENRSLLVDLAILVETAFTVLRRQGISQDGHATMPEFRGERGDEQAG